MTFTRDLAWATLDHLYRSGISHQLARYALTLKFELLPEEVVHQAKRCLLDALGCAIGAYDAPGRSICEETVKELGGKQEATVFGSGLRTTAMHAALVNSFLVRFLDFNDLGGGGHNSDSISAILATAERENANGRDFLTSLVISYELGGRFRDSTRGLSLETRGWNDDLRGGLIVPPALGRLMGLGEEQIANAIGICASHALPLGILDADREEMTMMKNIRFGMVGYQAILACLLAKRGFTGPIRVVEGDSGIRDVILKGDMDLERLTDFSGWRILNTRHKYVSANGSSLGYLLATLELVKTHDLKPEEIAAVRIKACARECNHTTNAAKKYARSAENADHSAFYMTAIAIKDRAIGPEQFRPEKFTDPVVLDLIERITIEADPGMPVKCFQGVSEITTKDGHQYQKRIDTPHGLGNDPLSDRELEEKFGKMASPYMDDAQIQKLFKTVWDLESVDDMGKLTGLMVFDR